MQPTLATLMLVMLYGVHAIIGPGWVVQNHALQRGNDLDSGNHTLTSAEAKCLQLRGCAGFTFSSNISVPSGLVHVYFKSSELGNTDPKWWTYLKPKPAFRFANTLGDHAVLQQAPAKASIWGFATSGQLVNVSSSGGGSVSAVAAADGTWQVLLPATEGSMTPHTISARSGSTTITLEDVLYGDVSILCAVRGMFESTACRCGFAVANPIVSLIPLSRLTAAAL